MHANLLTKVNQSIGEFCEKKALLHAEEGKEESKINDILWGTVI